jgi:hypothetical protein
MSFESPVSILANEEGNLVALSASQAMPSEQPGLPVMGKDASGNAQFLKLSSTGELAVSASVDIDLKAYADGGTDSVTVYGDLAALRQEGAPGEERLMVSGAVDMAGPGFDSLLTAVNSVSGAVDGLGLDLNSMNSNLGGKLDTIDTSVNGVSTAVGLVETAVNNVSGAIDGLGLSVDAVTSAVNAVSGAVDGLGLSVDAVNTSVLAVSSAIDSLGGGLSLVNISSSLGDVNDSVLAVSGALAELVLEGRSTSATVTSIAGSSGTGAVAASDVRKGIIFYMEGNNTAYVKFGSGASSSDYSVAVIGPGGLYELSDLRYSGAFSIAFKSSQGNLRITELE